MVLGLVTFGAVVEALPHTGLVKAEQLTTRSDPRFVELRGHVYAQVQKAKQHAAR